MVDELTPDQLRGLIRSFFRRRHTTRPLYKHAKGKRALARASLHRDYCYMVRIYIARIRATTRSK